MKTLLYRAKQALTTLPAFVRESNFRPSFSCMGRRRCIAILPFVCLASAWFVSVRAIGFIGFATADAQEKTPNPSIPPYHDSPPETPQPAVMDPQQFDKLLVRNAYRLSQSLRDVLYQLPCYCHCERHQGHRSLLDCYASTHTAGCKICLQELYYTYEQTNRGRTVPQIRDAIIHGDWKTLDTAKYEQSLPGSPESNP